MTKQKFTAGEWVIEELEIPEYQICSPHKIICWTGFSERPSMVAHDERKANALLLHAAPNLFKACERALGELTAIYNRPGFVSPAMSELKEAIAKAKGRTP